MSSGSFYCSFEEGDERKPGQCSSPDKLEEMMVNLTSMMNTQLNELDQKGITYLFVSTRACIECYKIHHSVDDFIKDYINTFESKIDIFAKEHFISYKSLIDLIKHYNNSPEELFDEIESLYKKNKFINVLKTFVQKIQNSVLKKQSIQDFKQLIENN
ncbi:MAG: hypothetical protein WC307_02625 [Candidatus Nanoarchaeia archaeon]|jgi:hypothetical protein